MISTVTDQSLRLESPLEGIKFGTSVTRLRQSEAEELTKLSPCRVTDQARTYSPKEPQAPGGRSGSTMAPSSKTQPTRRYSMYMPVRIRKDKLSLAIRSTEESTRDGRLLTFLNIQKKREDSTSNSDSMKIENSFSSTDNQTVYSSVMSVTLTCTSKSEDTRMDNQSWFQPPRDGYSMVRLRPSSLSTRKPGVSVFTVVDPVPPPTVKAPPQDGGNSTSTMDNTSSTSRTVRHWTPTTGTLKAAISIGYH